MFKYGVVYFFVYCATVILFVSNLFLIYILFEMMTVCLIFMTLMKGLVSNEFVLKYFNFLIFIEILLLFGFCLIYIVFGTLDIIDIYMINIVFNNNYYYFIYYLAFFFIIFSFLFKIGVFPFHFYIADLYRTCNVSTILLFSTLPKFIYFYFLDIFLKIFFYMHNFDSYVFFSFMNLLVSFFFFFLIFSLIYANIKIITSVFFMDILAYSSISFYSLLLLPFFIPAIQTFDFFYFIGLFLLSIYSFSLILFVYYLFIFNFFISSRRIHINSLMIFVKGDIFVFLFFLFFLLSFSGLPFFLGFFIKFFFYLIVLKSNFLIIYFMLSLSFTFSFFYAVRLFRFLIFGFFSVKVKNFDLKNVYPLFSTRFSCKYLEFYIFICLVFLFIVFSGFFFFFV